MKIKTASVNGFVPLERTASRAKFTLGQRLSFHHCHRDQANWIKQVFTEQGIVQGIFWDEKNNDVVYQLNASARVGKIYAHEQDIIQLNTQEQSACPWGQVESKACDGIIVHVDHEVNATQLLKDVVAALRLNVIDYYRHKRKLHILLKTATSVVRVSYDNVAEFKVFAKRVNFHQASEALMA
ncbi:hypothetical protein [Ferrimonas kyonanensis]|uniref:hypothetical protein n=1 Tax=Ferrimonas kyonanensis TaxID=364763 RepID=UPI000484A5CA|nr:hypothetical protein [Ferrimonas kyonanensis]